MSSSTILVSNRLPVRIDEDGSVIRTTGGLASALAGAGIESVWVGWPGIADEEIGEREQLEASMAKVATRPVYLNEDDIDGFYHGYANSTIWPLLHYMIERAEFRGEWFQVYQSVNEKFAEAVLDIARDGDTVWIHDYHLFLLPQLLRESGRELKIGFFLHTPFPSSEIFRTLPQRRELLRGLLGADLLGFHTYNYLRHFRSSVLRVLGIESEVDSVWVGERAIKLGVYPIGHDHQGFTKCQESQIYRDRLEVHEKELDGMRLVLSVERLDYTKGVPQKLAAIRQYLADHPDARSITVFVIIAVPSRVGVEEYDLLTEEVQREVGAINGDFGTVGHSPVQFLHRGFPQEELAALYSRADVCLVTPLIDGMNLVAKEYIDCKNEDAGARPGVLVLSEFAGAAQEMSHALMVNPHDVEETARTIGEALAMPDKERRRRSAAMQDRLRKTDASAWATGFLQDLNEVEASDGVGKGSSGLQGLMGKLLPPDLDTEKPLALFLDYDGTLRSFTDSPAAAVPDPELEPLLQEIASIPWIRLAIVSGRPASFLQEHFGQSGITLVAEHGYRVLRPGAREWELLHEGVDTDWKQSVLPLLDHAARLTPGSHIEEKRSSIVWHYRRADPEFGLWRAHGFLDELTDVTASLPVSVHHGNKIVEIASQLVNKGQAVKILMGEWNAGRALAVGDDQTDETMFALEQDDFELFSVHVGQGSTRASYRVDLQGFRRFLESFRSELNERESPLESATSNQ